MIGRTYFSSSVSPHSPKDEPVPVWVVSGSTPQQERLVGLIDHQPDLKCTLASDKAEDAVAALGQGEVPQVVLMTLELPRMNGTEATRQIKGRCPTSQIVILTAHEDEDKVREALCAGACGYLLKPVSDDRIVDAIKTAHSDGVPLSPPVARTVLRLFRQHVRPRADYGLTAREREVLGLLVEDHTQKEIAAELFVSPHTVDTHLRNIYRKLEVRSRSGAIVKALRERLL